MKSNHFHLYYSNKGKMLLPSTHKEAYQVALLNRSCFNNNDVSSYDRKSEIKAFDEETKK